MTAAPYSCWPVFVIPLELSFNGRTSLIISGYLGDNMSVYMEPLIDDMLHAWEEGVWTYEDKLQNASVVHVLPA